MKDWDDLKYILAIHRQGGLSAAARSLGVSHATVSRRLSAYENKQSVRLFERFSDGMQATEFGERAVEAALEIEKHILDLDLSITGKDSDLSGPLKVAAPQLIIQIALADIIKNFVETYPQIDLSIIATTDSVNLHRREADVSIRATNAPEENLWGRKYLSQKTAYFGSRHYLENTSNDTDLKCLNFIWRGNDPAPEVLKTYPNANVIAKFDDMIAVLGAVKAQMGIARMPCFIGDSDPELQRVENIPLADYSDIWILTHPDLKNVKRYRKFMQFVGQELEKKQPLFLGQTKKDS